MCLSLSRVPILCNPMNCSLPGSSVHGIFQARISGNSLLQGILSIQGSNPGLSQCRQILYLLNHQGIYLYFIRRDKSKISSCVNTCFCAQVGLPRWVVLVIKNLSANAGDLRGIGLIPGSGRGHDNPLQRAS